MLILDTETTGLGHRAEVIEIAVIDADTGEVKLNTRVQPVYSVPQEVTKIHGITDEDLVDAPTWYDVAPAFHAAVDGQDIAIYNADFDLRMIKQSLGMQGQPLWTPAGVHCVMLAYSKFRKEWNHHFKGWRWHKLVAALEHERIPWPDSPAHSALGDTLATRLLMQHMAGFDAP